MIPATFPFFPRRYIRRTLATTLQPILLNSCHWYSGCTFKWDILQEKEKGNISHIVDAKDKKYFSLALRKLKS